MFRRLSNKLKSSTSSEAASVMGNATPFTAEAQLRASDDDLVHEANESQPVENQRRLDKENTGTSLQAATVLTKARFPYKYIPLNMGGSSGRTHMVSTASREMIEREVSLSDLEAMTTFFYDQAFQDPVLDPFIRSHSDDHGRRFATWIYQKLTGAPIWDENRHNRDLTPVTLADGYKHVVHDRSSAHAAAWYSPKRPAADVGRHFQLGECRVWMRLHFWALRESKLVETSPSFVDYYVRFIAHFVRVYESTAPAFARDSYRWSADPQNIQKYLQNGRKMPEIMGLSLKRAKAQIPEQEAFDDAEWPYVVSNPWNPLLDDRATTVTNQMGH
jgi:hypothetical protein